MKFSETRWFNVAGLLSLLIAGWLGPVSAQAGQALPDDEKMCMAFNIYHEARGESKRGKLAVAAVTMNRVKSSKYPDSICDVVWQPYQFSWTMLPEKRHLPKEGKAWQASLKIAREFSAGKKKWNGIGKATHYHNDTVRPRWSAKSRLVAQVGRHSFYTL